MKELLILLISVLFLAGCAVEPSHIPSGTYTSSELGIEERIEVRGGAIDFHIMLNESMWDRKFENHFVYSDGNIVLLPISSNEFDFLHRQCNLKFDGKVILKEDIETKKNVMFVKDD